MESEIQWFIARDGKQHGPVSDLEMRKLVELGHLRPTDLIWRQGFPDWRPAPAVFASQPPAPPQRPQPALRSAPQPQRARPAQQQTTAPRFDPALSGPALEPAFSHPGQLGHPGPQQGALRHDVTTGGRRAGGPAPAELRQDQAYKVPEPLQHEPVGFDDAEEGGGRGKRIMALLALLALLGGGGWLAYQNLGTLKNMAAQQLKGSPATAESSAAPVEQAAAAAPAEASAEAVQSSAAALDARLQQQKHWALVRQGFADWYQKRVMEAGRLAAEKKPDAEVEAYLTEGLVELRRAHHDKALAASTPTLKVMAEAFLANIGRLSQESTNACMSFILKGESSAPVVEIISNPQKNAEINAHFAAIFSAVEEGARAPVTHSDPNEADYQLLVAQLTKLGWTPGDLQLFADPRGPAKTTPERYCTMMSQFFAAHLAVEDAAAQERLLYRTLKLVVAG